MLLFRISKSDSDYNARNIKKYKKVVIVLLVLCSVSSSYNSYLLSYAHTDINARVATQTDSDEIILPENEIVDNVFASWPFKDVRQTDSGANEMLRAYNYGLMKGFGDYNSYGQQSFRPKKNVTRAQFAISLYNLAKYLGYNVDYAYRGDFDDLKMGENGSEEMGWCYANGIMGGFPNGKFKPKNEITRAQMCIMLFNFATLYSFSVSGRSDISKYSDVSSLSTDSQVRIPIKWALYSRIIYGVNINGRLYLNHSRGASRAQCAMLLIRFMDNKRYDYNQCITKQQADRAIRRYMATLPPKSGRESYSGIDSEDNYNFYAHIQWQTGHGELLVSKKTGLARYIWYDISFGEKDDIFAFNTYSYFE